MGLRTLIASILIASPLLAQSRACEPLEYFWPHAPYELYSDIEQRDPGLEVRVLAESEKIPGPYRALLSYHSPRAKMVLAHESPSQVAYFTSLDPDALTTAGTRIEDSAAFVSLRLMRGYYNPERVAQGTGSYNAILHEYGHLVYEVLGIPDAQELLDTFDAVSEGFQEVMKRSYPRQGRSDEEYRHIILHETFAESFARMYARESSREFFARDHPELVRFMESLEERAIEVLDRMHAFGFDERCALAYLINPSGWRPQSILNVPDALR